MVHEIQLFAANPPQIFGLPRLWQSRMSCRPNGERVSWLAFFAAANVLGGTMRSSVAISLVGLLATSTIAPAQDQTVTVGPWTIATSFKAEKFDNCTMNRSVSDLDITFLRTRDGLLLLLDSSKWKLDRGKAYDVTLAAGTRAIQVKALAENRSVTIPLADRSLNERMRIADVLEVRGEGATLRVPLDGSMAALGRLETCFEKNNRTGVDSNPFVAPSRKP
jgi:hypothetical protein